MTSELSKAEYLKRYIENDDEKKAKRKKKPKQTNPLISRMKIVDQNIDIKSIKFGDDGKDEPDEDEEPIVADIIDDRPVEEKLKEVYESSRWKKLDTVSDDSNQQKDIPYPNSVRGNSREQTHAKRRHDSDSDISPPRTALSRTRHDSDSDCSPPRKHPSDIQSKKRHDSDSDCSPPRKHPSDVRSKKHHDSDSDISSSRRNRESVRKRNISSSHSSRKESRKVRKAGSDSDLSPERIRKNRKRPGSAAKNSDSDLSPPRVTAKGDSLTRESKKRPNKTLSGLNAGLQDATSLRTETAELRIREKKLINELDEELSGRNAETIVRDKRSGKKRNLEEENNVDLEKQKRLAEQQKIYSEWGKGLEQSKNQKSKLEEDMKELSKPLARYCDDEDLEARLKAVIHDDDPMAEYIKKKKRNEAVSAIPEYQGPPAPPNRFGIKPGYRWDGVDRSNGFEKKYFEKNSNSKALEEEAYLWSVQDM